MTAKRQPAMKALKQSSATRRNNIRALFGEGRRFANQAALAAALSVTEPYLTQLIGPNPTRRVSETTARKFEHKLRLAQGSLDQSTGEKA